MTAQVTTKAARLVSDTDYNGLLNATCAESQHGSLSTQQSPHSSLLTHSTTTNHNNNHNLV